MRLSSNSTKKGKERFVIFVFITRVCHGARTLYTRLKHIVTGAGKKYITVKNIGQTQGDIHIALRNVQCRQTKLKGENHTMNNDVNISINTIDKVRKFSATIYSVSADVDIISGRYTIDAKSIIGIFSLDITQPLTLHIHAATKKEYDEVIERIKDFII